MESLFKIMKDWGEWAAHETSIFFKSGVTQFSNVITKIKNTALAIFYTIQAMAGYQPVLLDKQLKKIQELYRQKSAEPLLALEAKPFAPEVTFDAEGNIGLMRPAPTIKRAVFEGGGMKGALHGPFFEVLNQELHILNSLEEVAGTSAGAMMAIMVAAGIPLGEIAKKGGANLRRHFKGKPLEGLLLGKLGIFPAHSLTQKIKKYSTQEASLYIRDMKKSEWERIKDEGNFKDFYGRAAAGFQEGLTFNDLRILHRLCPEKFKRLHVTAFNSIEKKPVYFNDELTPHVLCHIAVRASMSIPLIFKPVILNGQKLQDGALGAGNKPLHLFSETPQEETILLVFDAKGRAHRVLHDPVGYHPSLFYDILVSPARKIAAAVKNFLLTGSFVAPHQHNKEAWRGSPPSKTHALYAGIPYWEQEQKDSEAMYELGPNVLVIPHTVKSFSFFVDENQIKSDIQVAIKAARIYADMRAGMLIHRKYDSIDEAIASLSPKEKQLIKELPEKEIEARINQGLAAYQKIDSEEAQKRLKILKTNADRKKDFYQRIRG